MQSHKAACLAVVRATTRCHWASTVSAVGWPEFIQAEQAWTFLMSCWLKRLIDSIMSGWQSALGWGLFQTPANRESFQKSYLVLVCVIQLWQRQSIRGEPLVSFSFSSFFFYYSLCIYLFLKYMYLFYTALYHYVYFNVFIYSF